MSQKYQFRIGERVRIINDLSAEQVRNTVAFKQVGISERMLQYQGQVFEIVERHRYNGINAYHLKGIYSWIWAEDWLSSAEDEEPSEDEPITISFDDLI